MNYSPKEAVPTVTASAPSVSLSVLASALLSVSPMGSVRRSPGVPLDLVLGCSAAAAVSRHTRPTLGTDALVRGLASQVGWAMRRLRAVLG